jgi:hypothetical protein
LRWLGGSRQVVFGFSVSVVCLHLAVIKMVLLRKMARNKFKSKTKKRVVNSKMEDIKYVGLKPTRKAANYLKLK